MRTNRRLTLVAIALLCLAQTGNIAAQAKKAGGGSSAERANKAVQLAQAGANDEAIAEFTLAIAQNPKDARLYNDRGSVYLTMRKFPEAAADFSKAIELLPKDHAGYSFRGAALNEQNQIDAAMADLNKALELKADDPKTLERRGLAYYRQKNYELALADYNKAIEQTPDSTLALSRRADAYVALKQFPQAQADLEAVLKIRPDDFTALDRLQFVKAKLAPPRAAAAPVAAAPAATVALTPKPKLLTRTNIFLAMGGLVVLAIIGVVIGKMMATRSVD